MKVEKRKILRKEHELIMNTINQKKLVSLCPSNIVKLSFLETMIVKSTHLYPKLLSNASMYLKSFLKGVLGLFIFLFAVVSIVFPIPILIVWTIHLRTSAKREFKSLKSHEKNQYYPNLNK